MRFGRRKSPDPPPDVFSFCEPSHATVYSRVHIRRVGPEGRKPGGGVPTLPLCGRDLAHGWDLPSQVTAERVEVTLDAEHNPTCRACAAAWVKETTP